MKFRFYLAILIMWMLGLRRFTALPRVWLLTLVRYLNGYRPFILPEGDDTLSFTDESVTMEVDGTGNNAGRAGNENKTETFHCLAIRHHKKQRKAILNIYGGGMLMAPQASFIKYAQDMARKTGCDVWFPYYPLCTDHTIRDSVRMIYRIYRKMLKKYDDIELYGYSSGGSLAMMLYAYNNEEGDNLPMPRKMVMVSPGGIPEDDSEYRKMKQAGKKDTTMSPKYLKTIRPLLSQGLPDIPEYMLTFKGANLKGLQKTWIYYGKNECLSVKANAYTQLLKRNRVDYQLKMAAGRQHCYCITDRTPAKAAKEDYNEIIRVLKEDFADGDLAKAQ